MGRGTRAAVPQCPPQSAVQEVLTLFDLKAHEEEGLGAVKHAIHKVRKRAEDHLQRLQDQAKVWASQSVVRAEPRQGSC